jgi:DNA-binding SARP family transcriptional activator
VQLARAAGELQVLVPALAGLARLSTTAAEVALVAAEEARRIAPASLMPFALTALGWVAMARGDHASAARLGAEAVAAAREEQALDLLADALELTAAAADDPERARRALTEALGVWRSGGAVPGEARVQVLIGRLDHADRTACSHARDAARRLRSLGILEVHGRPLTEEAGSLQVAVRVLGGFDVRVDHCPVPLPAWRSRQARTLVKILAGRRGRPVTRDHLCELLWPDADPAKTGHRLSVLLATVRGVLDPRRAWPPDHYVAADLRGLRLDLGHVDLDADRLLKDASLAAELMDAGDLDRAREILTEIDARYHGPAFEDEPYEEWADGFREEVRASWQRSLRRLASLHSRQGRVADAQVLLVRLLGSDPYDAPMHRLLVHTLARAGRHGEAERAFTRWARAMAAIGAPPPDRGVLVGSVLTSR